MQVQVVLIDKLLTQKRSGLTKRVARLRLIRV